MRVLIAPDSFKGTLTSVQVAEALAQGWLRERPDDEIVLAPLADGGEGTLVAVHAAGGWTWREARAHDPLGRPCTARWLARDDGRAAFVEMAQASGLSLVAPDERDPVAATTLGTGEVLRAVLDAGIREIALGIGGSATTDGGAGALRGLGAHVSDDLAQVDLTGLDPRLPEVSLRIASDVTNPLLGEQGAAAVYGPQKGADPATVSLLDARLARFADALEAATGRHERETPGAGAAGGLGFGLLCLRGYLGTLGLVPGIDLVMAEAGFDTALARADLVLTGEGRIDSQTAFGKTAMGVARRAQAAGVRCIGVGGSVTPEGVEALAQAGAEAIPVHDEPVTLDEAIAAGAAPLVACGKRLAYTEWMPSSRWRDTVAALAGAQGRLSEEPDPEWDGMVLAQLEVPGALFRMPGPTSEDAWRTIAHSFGQMRVLQAMEDSDWTDVDEFIDQVSFVVARDPAGRVWGIEVVSEGSGLAGDLDRWVAVDERPEWVAYVDPIETRSWESLQSAIARRGRRIQRA